MTFVITENIVSNREEYLKLARAFAEDGRNDKGCHGMEVYLDPEKTDTVVFVSTWDAKEDFLGHVHGPSFAKHIPGMAKYYVSGSDRVLVDGL